MSKGRLDGLDGLRGIAAICVLLLHAFPDCSGTAYLAVDFFFMLSGYVMARSYEGRLRAGSDRRAFLQARLRRLCPTVFLSSIFALPWLLTQPGGADVPLIAACLVLPWIINPPAWSIGFELFANFLHAWVLARSPTVHLAWVAAGLAIVLALAVRGAGLDLTPGNAALASVALRTVVPYIGGIVLYRCWQDAPPVAVPAGVTWFAMPAVFALSILVPWLRGWPDFLFTILLCPLLISGGLRNGSGNRIARFAGSLSFPLYAAHGPAMLGTRAMGIDAYGQIAAALAAGFLILVMTNRLDRRLPRARLRDEADAVWSS